MFLATLAYYYLTRVGSTISRPGLSVEDPFNAIHLCNGLLLALLALLTLNAGLRGQKALGPIDFVAKAVATVVLLPPTLYQIAREGLPALFRWFVGVVVLINAIGFLLFLAADYRPDPPEAFVAQIDPYTVTSTGGILFGNELSGGQGQARLTPALVRALDRAGVSIGETPGRLRELVLPGLLPLAMLFGLIVLRILGRLLSGRSSWQTPWVAEHRRTMVWSGIIGLYVMGWMAIGQLGTELQVFDSSAQLGSDYAGQASRLAFGPIPGAETGVEPGSDAMEALERVVRLRFVRFMVAVGVFLITALLVALAVHQASERTAVDEVAMLGWTLLYTLVLIAGVSGIYFVSFTSAGSPVGPWVFAYGILAAMCWYASLPREFFREEI